MEPSIIFVEKNKALPIPFILTRPNTDVGKDFIFTVPAFVKSDL